MFLSQLEATVGPNFLMPYTKTERATKAWTVSGPTTQISLFRRYMMRPVPNIYGPRKTQKDTHPVQCRIKHQSYNFILESPSSTFILQRALLLENLKVKQELFERAPRPRPGPNFMALLTVSKVPGLAEAGNSVLTSSVIHWLAGILACSHAYLPCKRRMVIISAELGGNQSHEIGPWATEVIAYD